MFHNARDGQWAEKGILYNPWLTELKNIALSSTRLLFFFNEEAFYSQG